MGRQDGGAGIAEIGSAFGEISSNQHILIREIKPGERQDANLLALKCQHIALVVPHLMRCWLDTLGECEINRRLLVLPIVR